MPPSLIAMEVEDLERSSIPRLLIDNPEDDDFVMVPSPSTSPPPAPLSTEEIDLEKDLKIIARHGVASGVSAICSYFPSTLLPQLLFGFVGYKFAHATIGPLVEGSIPPLPTWANKMYQTGMVKLEEGTGLAQDAYSEASMIVASKIRALHPLPLPDEIEMQDLGENPSPVIEEGVL